MPAGNSAGNSAAAQTQVFVRSRKLLGLHRPPRPSLLVVLSTNGYKLSEKVAGRYDHILEWRVSDVEVPDKSEDPIIQLVAKGKLWVSLLTGHLEIPDEYETALFINKLERLLKEHRFRSVTVSCALGVSRSPAVAIFLTEKVLNRPEEAERLKRRFKLYNRTLYKNLVEVYEDMVRERRNTMEVKSENEAKVGYRTGFGEGFARACV